MSKIKLIVPLFVICTLSSCNENFTMNYAKGTINKTVIIPNDMIVVRQDIEEAVEICSDPTFIIYISSSDCIECKLAHLIEFTILIDELENMGIRIMIILTPPSGRESNYASLLQTMDIGMPIYLDIHHTFERVNSFMPNNYDYHCILTDSELTIVYDGYPSGNHFKTKSFYKTIKNKVL